MPEDVERELMEPREIDDPVGIGLDRARGELAKDEVIDVFLPQGRWMFHTPEACAPGRACSTQRRSQPRSGFVQPCAEAKPAIALLLQSWRVVSWAGSLSLGSLGVSSRPV